MHDEDVMSLRRQNVHLILEEGLLLLQELQVLGGEVLVICVPDISCLPLCPPPPPQAQFIASGAFCDVYSCKYRGWEVVAKRVRADLPAADKRAALANLWNEHECLRVLRHPNIIDVYGIW